MRSCKTKVRRRSAPAPPQAPLNHKPRSCKLRSWVTGLRVFCLTRAMATEDNNPDCQDDANTNNEASEALAAVDDTVEVEGDADESQSH